MKDQHNRQIDYARISVTSKCNLKCKYCFDSNISKYTSLLTNDIYTIIDTLYHLNFKKVRFTGGEPLLHNDILNIVEYACKHINDVGITTNGLLLDKFINEFKKVGLKRINISIDTLNQDEFLNLTNSGEYNKILENILTAKELGFTIKINIVLIKEFKDNYQKFIDFGKKHDIPIRFIELMKLGTNKQYVVDNFFSSYDLIKLLNANKHSIESSDVCDYYETDNYVFGIISPISNHFCSSCNRIRFTSNYKLRLCLHARCDYDIKDYLSSSNDLKDYILKIISLKQEAHELNENVVIDKNMVEIGG